MLLRQNCSFLYVFQYPLVLIKKAKLISFRPNLKQLSNSTKRVLFRQLIKILDKRMARKNKLCLIKKTQDSPPQWPKGEAKTVKKLNPLFIGATSSKALSWNRQGRAAPTWADNRSSEEGDGAVRQPAPHHHAAQKLQGSALHYYQAQHTSLASQTS